MDFFRKLFQNFCEIPVWDCSIDKSKNEMNWSCERVHTNSNRNNGFPRPKRRKDIKSIDTSVYVREKKRLRTFSHEQHSLHKDRRHHNNDGSSSLLPTNTNPNPWIIWTIYLAVIFVSTVSYSNSLDGDFVHDDLSAITTNEDVIGKSSIWNIFLNDFWGKPMADRSSHKSYRPLTILTFRLNAYIHELNPRGFHIFNVALHATVSTVFVKMCLQVAKMSLTSAFIAGLHFSIHPIHTEAVSGIVGRADILACLFLLMSLLSYDKCQKGNNKKQLILSLLLSLSAMLSKEHGITVLGINFCWDIFVNQQQIFKYMLYRCVTVRMRQLLNRLGFVSVWGLILIFFRLSMLQGSLPQFSDQDNPASFSSSYYTRMRTFAYLPAFNFWLLLAPISLNYDWQMGSIPLISQWTDGRNFGCLIFYLLLCSGFVYPAWKGRPGRPEMLGLMLLTIPFIPAMNILFPVGFVVAERILYIPSLGFSVLVGAGAGRIIMSFQTSMKIRLTKIILVLVLSLFASKTWQRNQDWRNRETLFTSGLKNLPMNAKMQYNIANLQKDLGNVDQAIYHYREALRLWPRHASAHNNLGTLLNDTVKAEKHFQQALRINPNHANAFFNLANLKHKDGQTNLAIRLMERSNELEPNNPDALTNLAAMYADVGMTEKARSLHLEVLNLEPESADHLNNFAAFLQKLGKLEDALKYYQKALNQDGNHTVALLNAARLMKKLKFNDKAEVLYQRALLRDDDPQTKYGLGVLYLNTGRAGKAEILFREILQQKPNDPIVKVHLAQANLHQRKFNEAETLLLPEIKRLKYVPREVLHQLATLYSHLNRTVEALTYIKLALTTCISTDLTCAAFYAFHGDLSKDLDDIESAIVNYQQAEKMLRDFCTNKKNLHMFCTIFTHVQLKLEIFYAQKMFQETQQQRKTAQIQDPHDQVLLLNIVKVEVLYKNYSCLPQK